MFETVKDLLGQMKNGKDTIEKDSKGWCEMVKYGLIVAGACIDLYETKKAADKGLKEMQKLRPKDKNLMYIRKLNR